MEVGSIYIHGDRTYEVTRIQGERVRYKQILSPEAEASGGDISVWQVEKMVRLGIWRPIIGNDRN